MRRDIFKIPVIVLLLLLSFTSRAQTPKIDSLLKALSSQKNDTGKIKTYSLIGKAFLEIDYKKSLEYARQGLNLSTRLGYQKGIAEFNFGIGSILREKGEYSESLRHLSKALEAHKQTANIKGQAEVLREMGIIHKNQSEYPKAMSCYLQSLKIFEQLGDKGGIASNYINIGVVYKAQNNNTDALQYYLKALELRKELGYKKGIADCYNNIGIVYKNLKDFPKALEYYNQCLELRKELKDMKGMSICYANLGVIHNQMKEYDKARTYIEESQKIKRELGDKKGMAINHINLGELFEMQGDPQDAIRHYNEARKIADDIGGISEARSAEKGLSDAYALLGKYKEAYEHHKLFKQFNDSIFNESNSRQMNDLKIRFEVDKKEAEMNARASAEQEKLQAVAEAEQKRQQTILYFIGGTLLLTFAFTGFLFSRFTIINRQKKIIEVQKEVVEEKNKQITASINYAQKIQTALLPDHSEFTGIFPQSFVLFKPKDIVSGDFYWCTSVPGKPHIKLYATADCTGHGVPGGFMSMLGTSFLNEIVNEKGITEPADILNLLREKVISALKQTGALGESKDGMDITLLKLDESSNRLTYASANNSFYIIHSHELAELKPDKMPVGYYDGIARPFTQHTINLQKGDTIYTFTDGYADQFGGSRNKKFTYKQLKDLIVSIHEQPVEEQKRILESTLEQWQGSYEQVDDICMIGVKIA